MKRLQYFSTKAHVLHSLLQLARDKMEYIPGMEINNCRELNRRIIYRAMEFLNKRFPDLRFDRTDEYDAIDLFLRTASSGKDEIMQLPLYSAKNEYFHLVYRETDQHPWTVAYAHPLTMTEAINFLKNLKSERGEYRMVEQTKRG